MQGMQLLKGTVRNGKFVVEETPTDLPEGAEVELVVVENPIDDATDELDDQERAELEESLREGIEQMKTSGDVAPSARPQVA
jgi:hypothetical protein